MTNKIIELPRYYTYLQLPHEKGDSGYMTKAHSGTDDSNFTVAWLNERAIFTCIYSIRPLRPVLAWTCSIV